VEKDTVNSFSKEILGECDVVAHDSSAEVVGHVVESVDHGFKVVVRVVDHQLEGTEHFLEEDILLSRVSEVANWHLDRSRLVGSVLLRDLGSLEGLAAEEEFGSGKGEDLVNMSLELLVSPSENGADGEVVVGSLGSLSLNLVHKLGSAPCSMHKNNGLSSALLTSMAVGIVVRLLNHVVNIGLAFRSIRAEDLPVEAGVLQADFASELFSQMLSDTARASEQGHLGVTFSKNVLDDFTFAVDEIHILLGHSAVLEHSHELLERQTGTGVGLNQGLVSHVQGAHHLEHGQLHWEVERSDHRNGAVGEAVA